MRKILLLLITVVTVISFSAYSQTAEIHDVRKNEFRGVYPIINKQTKEPQGYYTFYVNEKAEKGMVNFMIAIFDLDLKLIKQTPITITKHSNVDGSEYNGEDFLFCFNDIRKKKITYVTVDNGGNIIKQKDVQEEKRYAATADVYPSNNGGFYIVKPIKEKKWGYSVERVDRNLNTLWEKQYMPEKGIIMVEAVESDKDKIIVIQAQREALMSRKTKAEFICLSDKTGDQIFKYSLFDGVDTAIPTSFLVDDEKNIITGGMYFEGEKMDNTNSDGIFFLKLTPNGEKLAYDKIDWDKGIQEVIQKTQKGISISSKPKVYFQDIVQGVDGNYHIISETFQKNYQLMSSGLKDAITGRFIGNLNSDGKPVTFEIMDFLLFDVSKNDLKLVGMNIVEKEHTKISVYPPYNGYNGLAMARIVDKFGWFNYAFTTHTQSGNDRILVSSNTAISEPYIGLNTIKSGQVSTMKKIPVDKKKTKGSSCVGCMRGRKGNICVYTYDKKEQTVSLYIEKIPID